MAQESWSDYTKALGSAFGLDEESEYLPESMKILKSHMEEALKFGGERYDTVESPESDSYRHVMGMRKSALEAEAGEIPSGKDMHYLDIPAFLRRQAD